MNKYLRPPNNANKTNHLSSLCNCLRTSGSNCNFDNFVNENGVLGASTKGNHHSNPHDWNELGGVFYTISIILMFSGVIIVLMFRSIKRSKNHMEIDTLLETMRYREELDNNCRQKKRLKKAKNKVTAWLNKNNEKVWTSSAQITIRRSPTFTRQRRESHISSISFIPDIIISPSNDDFLYNCSTAPRKTPSLSLMYNFNQSRSHSIASECSYYGNDIESV